MDLLVNLTKQARSYLFGFMVLAFVLIGGIWYVGAYLLNEPLLIVIPVTLFSGLILLYLISNAVTSYLLEPTKLLIMAINHVGADSVHNPPPKVEEARLGRELVTKMTLQIFQMASK